MDSHALYLSLVLMAAGMVVIFVFMGALIAIVHFYLKAAERFFPDRPQGGETGTSAGSGAGNSKNGEEVAAAIAAALGSGHE
jgi:sodium pump decarboxylase gamma subunit